MDEFLFEISYFKKKAETLTVSNDGFENLMDRVNIRSKAYKSPVWIRKEGKLVFKLGKINALPYFE